VQDGKDVSILGFFSSMWAKKSLRRIMLAAKTVMATCPLICFVAMHASYRSTPLASWWKNMIFVTTSTTTSCPWWPLIGARLYMGNISQFHPVVMADASLDVVSLTCYRYGRMLRFNCAPSNYNRSTNSSSSSSSSTDGSDFSDREQHQVAARKGKKVSMSQSARERLRLKDENHQVIYDNPI
jgi:hypothetical protein